MSHGRNPGSIGREHLSASLLQEASRLFFPLALSMMLSSTIGVTDMYLAGFMGTKAQAAVGLGDQLLFLVIVFGSGLATACSSFVSKTIGAQDFGACRRYARASLSLAVLVGILSALAGIVCARPVLQMLGCANEVAILAVPYTAYNALANAPFVVSLCLSAIFRALGRPLLSVYLWLITALLTNGLSVLLFFSGIKAMKSLDSLAIGWDIGCLVGCIFGLVLFKRVYRDLQASLPETIETPEPGARGTQCTEPQCTGPQCTGPQCAGPQCTGPQCAGPQCTGPQCTDREAIIELIRVGAPAVVTELSLVISHFLMYRLLACSAESATLQAAWTIKLKLEEVLALIPLMSLGMTTGVIVGQNLGAGAESRAVRACLSLAATASLAMLVLGGLISFAAPSLAACFSSDSATQDATTLLLAPCVVLFPLNALSSIVCAGMEGAGETRLPMILNLFFQVLGRIGLAYILGAGQSVQLAGIGLGLCLAQMLMACATLLSSYLRYRGRSSAAVPEHSARLESANGMDASMTSP